MKEHITKAIRLTLILVIGFSGIYTIIIWIVAQLVPGSGKGDIIQAKTKNTSKYYANVGQSFTQDIYFNSRPSAVNYNAGGSGGSNKGPSNEEYLKVVQDRINDFKSKNPTVKTSDIPVELVTASGSGLDPDISPKGALVQIDRIASKRGLKPEALRQLVNGQTKPALFGVFGPESVNVLKLNIALDQLSGSAVAVK